MKQPEHIMWSQASQEDIQKLKKEDFDVDSWQFQLLERHESNDLNSYTVAELRQLMRFDILSLVHCFRCWFQLICKLL